jgi:isopenicillin N synthase-like dioxygenase
LPQDKLAWEDPRANRGYVKIGRERVTQSSDAAEIAELRNKAPDIKESMEIGRDWDKTWRNYWPQESDVPGFKQTILDFFQVCGITRRILFVLTILIRPATSSIPS